MTNEPTSGFMPSMAVPISYPLSPSSSAHSKVPGIEPSRKHSLLFDFDSVAKDDNDQDTQPLIDDFQPISAPKPPKLPAALRAQRSVKLIHAYQLIGITIFAVTGGPFGFEDTVGAGGPVLMLFGLLLFSVLWSAPLALMTTELSCMIPLSGGHVLWIYRAFGPFWSFVNSCFALTYSVLDNALYAVVFVEYLSSLFYGDSHRISRVWSVVLKISVTAVVTTMNICGITIVGTAAMILAIAALSPFVAMIFKGLPYLNFSWTHGETPPVIDWRKFVTLLLWNTSGFDGAGTIASEVRNPARSYPRAMTVSVMVIFAIYGLPTLIGVSVIPHYENWRGGTYMLAAKIIGGHRLQIWMGLSEVLSALGLLLTRLCINSRIVYGMALVDQVPTFLSKVHPRYGTPWIAILVTSFVTLLLTGFNFYSLAEADMFFYALSTILKFGALVQLRFTEPDAFRPLWIPVPRTVLAVLTVIPIGFCISMVCFASYNSQAIGLIGAIVAIFFYIIKEIFPQYGKKAEEVVQQRMTHFQQTIDQMQQRIDYVIAKEFKTPLQNLGHAFHTTEPSESSIHMTINNDVNIKMDGIPEESSL